MIGRFIDWVYWTFTGRIRERWATGLVNCSKCGTDAVVVISTLSKCYDEKTGAINNVECRICGGMSASTE